MWEPAFCAGFQAPRAGYQFASEMSINPLSERHFHSEASIFQDLARLFRFLSDLGPKVPFSQKAAQYACFYRFSIRAI